MREPSVRRRHDGECACAARCNTAATVHFLPGRRSSSAPSCVLSMQNKAAAGQQRTEFPKGAVKLDELMRRQQRQPRILGRHVLDCDARETERAGSVRHRDEAQARAEQRKQRLHHFYNPARSGGGGCRWRALGGVNCVCMMSGINPVLLGMTSTFALCDEHI